MLIVNTKSRRGNEWFAQAKDELSRQGVGLKEALAIQKPKDIGKEVQKAIQANVPLVIVGGGDGTLSSVVKYFIGSNSTLGVLPLGTGNQFARDLGIESDIAVACEVIASGKDVNVDVGVANEDYFINVTTVGLTTLIAESLTVTEKRRFGRFVYVIALIRAIRKIKPFQVTLTTPEGTKTVETLQVVIGNGRFHAGPFPLAPNAHITDGKLTVYVLGGTSRWELVKLALNLPGGHQVSLPEVTALQVPTGKLSAVPNQRVTVDGEIELNTPLQFRIEPRALRVRVPQAFEG